MGSFKGWLCYGGYFNELEHKALPNNLEPKLEYEIKIGDVLISRANTKNYSDQLQKFTLFKGTFCSVISFTALKQLVMLIRTFL
jgi:hypothetical protein